jgi:hypothetical protein
VRIGRSDVQRAALLQTPICGSHNPLAVICRRSHVLSALATCQNSLGSRSAKSGLRRPERGSIPIAARAVRRPPLPAVQLNQGFFEVALTLAASGAVRMRDLEETSGF